MPLVAWRHVRSLVDCFVCVEYSMLQTLNEHPHRNDMVHSENSAWDWATEKGDVRMALPTVCRKRSQNDTLPGRENPDKQQQDRQTENDQLIETEMESTLLPTLPLTWRRITHLPRHPFPS
jgi:hypothetical protein